MTTNWNHVDDDLTREVLEGKRTDDASITKVLEFAEQCLQADQHNEEVTDKIYSVRAAAIVAAYECWHFMRDTEGTLTALRFFWGN
jgi:hypothetical protein